MEISNYSNGIRASATNLMAIVLSNSREIDIQWGFYSYFYWYHQVKYLCNVLKIAKLNDPIFFPDCEIKYSWNLLSLRKNKTKCEEKKKIILT